MRKNYLLEVLTPINFLLSLLIVFHHAFTVNINYCGSFWPQAYGWTIGIQRMMYNLSECAVPMFYFLSAYLFYRTYDGTWNTYKEKITRRCYSLLIPYLIFCTFGYIKHLAVTGLSGWSIIGYLHSLLICDTMPLWFIRELMVLSLLAPVFWKIIKNKYITAVVFISLIVLIVLGYIPYRNFLYWTPVYLMGAMLTNDYLCKLYTAMYNKRYAIVSLLLLVVYVIWAWFLPNGLNREEMGYADNLIYILFRIVTPVILLPLAWYIYRYQMRERSYMKYSFFVYCMHFPVISFLGLIFDRFLGVYLNNELVKYLLIVLLTYTICVLIAMALQRFTPSIWYVLNGHRR